MKGYKVFNYIMISLLIISAIMSFLAPLYCTPKELKMIIDNLPFKSLF